MVPSNDLLALAGTLYGEIRGGTDEQVQNIAQVILNRHNTGNRPSIRSVCLAPGQFSCWNTTDVNRPKILSADTTEPVNWKRMLSFAHLALAGENPDRVNGARNYYAKGSDKPWWAKVPRAVVTLQDGASIFVRGV